MVAIMKCAAWMSWASLGAMTTSLFSVPFGCGETDSRSGGEGGIGGETGSATAGEPAVGSPGGTGNGLCIVDCIGEAGTQGIQTEGGGGAVGATGGAENGGASGAGQANAGAGAGGGDAAVSSFCSQQSGYLFCEDFDNGAWAAQWDSVSLTKGSAGFSDDSYSAPRAGALTIDKTSNQLASATLKVSVPISALTYRLSYRLKLSDGCTPYNNQLTWIDQLTFPGAGSNESVFLVRIDTRGYTPNFTEVNGLSSFSASGQRTLKLGEWMKFVQQYYDGVHSLKVDDLAEVTPHSGWGHATTQVELVIGPNAPNGWADGCKMSFDDILLEAL